MRSLRRIPFSSLLIESQTIVCSGCGERTSSGSGTKGDIASKTERVYSCCGKESKRICDVSDPPQSSDHLPVRSLPCLRLQERHKTEWKEQVRLHFGDMRTLELPEKVDILITELLGSFGDNELSPECLDGAVRFLKRERIRTMCLIFSTEHSSQPGAFLYHHRTPHTSHHFLRPSYSMKSGVMRA